MDHIGTNNLNTNTDQINEANNNEPTFNNNSFNLSSRTSDPLPLVTVSLQGGNKHRATTISDITCLWDSGSTNSTMKRKHTKHYELKIQSNKVGYSTADGVYCTTHDVTVPFCMPGFSSSKVINHRFCVDNKKGESGIGYDMIIGRDLMVHIGLTADFMRQLLQHDVATVHMKEPSILLWQSNLTKHEMHEVVMQTAEPAFTQEATERMVEIFDITYSKADLKQVYHNATQLNAE